MDGRAGLQPLARRFPSTLWFTGRNRAGRLEITGPGSSAALVLDSTPEPRPEMACTDQERVEEVAGLTESSWPWAGRACKHALRVSR
jgi:hypothetical protein